MFALFFGVEFNRGIVLKNRMKIQGKFEIDRLDKIPLARYKQEE
jgi:hypothetical protein